MFISPLRVASCSAQRHDHGCSGRNGLFDVWRELGRRVGVGAVSEHHIHQDHTHRLVSGGFAEPLEATEHLLPVLHHRATAHRIELGELGDLISRIASTRSEIVGAKLQSLQLQKELQREVAAELDDVQREDATLVAWSLLQFASQREGRPAAQLLRGLAEEKQVGLGKIAQPLRVAICGNTISPPIFDAVDMLGMNTVLKRIENTLSKFQQERE